MTRALTVLLLTMPFSLSQARTFLVTFTGYSISPSGETCGGQNVYGEGVSYPGTGMLEILKKLRGKLPESQLEMRAFTYFNAGQGLACTAPFDGEADHKAAEEFLRGKVAPGDFVIVAGHSYGGHRAALFAEQFQRKFGRPVSALVLADAIDWTACSIRGVLSGGTLSDCRQNGMTLDLAAAVATPSSAWNYRQQRGLRVWLFTLPVLFGYNLSAGGQPVQTFVLNTTHTEVDDSTAVQSLLEGLALKGSITVSNEASEAEAISQ